MLLWLFQSAPLTEARGDSYYIVRQSSFQSAPLTEARGDLDFRFPIHLCAGFNPLPLPKQGETSSKRFSMSLKVSIRSPYRSKGRHLANMLVDPLPRFQSAPLTEARGDQAHRRHLRVRPWFQSAPLTEARGDKEGLTGTHERTSFNPLPLPKQGETYQEDRGDYYCTLGKVSIRSPYRSKGRQPWHHNTPDYFQVSIRSPYRSKGRHNSDRDKVARKLFQSAPLTEARGETLNQVSIRSPSRRDLTNCSLAVEVSIRSPYRSKGRLPTLRVVYPLSDLENYHSVLENSMFQSAPLTEARGDCQMPENQSFKSFQSGSKGRFSKFPHIMNDVSIRSPYRSKGRLNPLPLPKQGETFSS